MFTPQHTTDTITHPWLLHCCLQASGALYGLLVSGRRLMALDCARSPPLHPSDILLTINFVSASESFR